ncbi:MAG: STAS domain-containing protein [Azoarcus sp.]|nr:STAS domain-containing protein [Azoarcus sp.]
MQKSKPGAILAGFVAHRYSMCCFESPDFSRFYGFPAVAFNFNPFKKNALNQSSVPESASSAGNSGAPTELSALDFSHASQQGAIEVTEVSSGVGVVYEEAAVLYANGNDRDAEHLLTAVFDDPTATVGEGLWMMLLDLYRLTGQRERFETRVIDYARRFERSPPAWEDLSVQPAKRRSDAAAASVVNLPASLSAQASQQLQQICVIANKSGALRIDLGRVRSVDDEGCALIQKTLAQLAASRVKLTIFNASRLVDLLAPKVKPGQAENRDYWMLMLEMLKYTGEAARFEDLAVDYAVTFEESPPSWESKQPNPGDEQPPAVEETPGRGEEEFYFDGELSGSSNEAIRKLDEFASARQTVLVDCSQLRRVDFVAAGTLFNSLASLQAQGKIIQLYKVNAMVGALMRVMSIDQVAQVMLRG